MFKLKSFWNLLFWPGIYDDDLEIVTLDSGDFGKNKCPAD